MDIYKITNKIDGKIYIGKSQEGYEQRFKEHVNNALNGSDKCPKLYNAMRKYGVKNFVCEKIDTRETPSDLCLCEKYWIEKLDAQNPSIGYNIANGGDGGYTWSPKGTITINNGIKNRQVQPEEVDKYLLEGWVLGGHTARKRPNVGKWVNDGNVQRRVNKDELDSYLSNGWVLGYTEKGKENLSVSHRGQVPGNKGKTLSEEERRHVSERTKEAMNTPEMKAKMRAIYDDRRGSKWVTNGERSLQVHKNEVEYYINSGYKLGRMLRKVGDVNE